MSTGFDNLKSNQRQLDADGIEVGVPRQAVDDVIAEYIMMRDCLQEIYEGAKGWGECCGVHAWLTLGNTNNLRPMGTLLTLPSKPKKRHAASSGHITN
jgi:hypothetical protein